MDSGWLGVLKASAWQLFGLSLSFGAFWLLLLYEVIPPINDPLVVYGLPLAVLICGGLGLASLIEQVVEAVKARLAERAKVERAAKAIADHQDQFRRDIDTFSAAEMHIFGYLLRESQKSFITQSNGGYATTLLNRKYVQMDVPGGHLFNDLDTPFRVPDHIWEVMVENSDKFPKDWNEEYAPWVMLM